MKELIDLFHLLTLEHSSDLVGARQMFADTLAPYRTPSVPGFGPDQLSLLFRKFIHLHLLVGN